MAIYTEKTPGAQAEQSFLPVAKGNGVTTGITYTSRSGGFVIDANNICRGWGKMVLSSKGAQTGAFTIDLPLAVKSGAVGQVVIGARTKIVATKQLTAKLAGGSNSIVFADALLDGTASTTTKIADLSDDSSVEFTFAFPL